MEFSIVELWNTMSWLARGIWIAMILMSLWMIAVAIERLITFSSGSKQSYQFVLQLRDQMQRRAVAEAAQAAEQYRKSPIAKVMQAGLTEYSQAIDALKKSGPDDVGEFDVVDAVNRSLERVKERETSNLRRGLGGLATIASTAPFVGLLGTVVGIIGAFQKLKTGGGMEVVGPSIAEALYMTAFGLGIAIPAAMLFNYYTNRVEFFVVDMNDVSSEFLDFVLKEGRTR